MRPLHGDALPTPAQIKVDVNESDKAYTVVAEVPGVKSQEIAIEGYLMAEELEKLINQET